MKPALIVDHLPESLLMHWLVLEKECPLDISVYPPPGAEMIRAPYYSDGDVLIYDHQVLVQFLQERYPGEQLLPLDPVSRAQIRQACELIRRPDDIDLMEEIVKVMETGTKYMAGKEFSLLDIYVGSWMHKNYNKLGVSAAVVSYWRRIASRAAFRIATS